MYIQDFFADHYTILRKSVLKYKNVDFANHFGYTKLQRFTE